MHPTCHIRNSLFCNDFQIDYDPTDLLKPLGSPAIPVSVLYVFRIDPSLLRYSTIAENDNVGNKIMIINKQYLIYSSLILTWKIAARMIPVPAQHVSKLNLISGIAFDTQQRRVDYEYRQYSDRNGYIQPERASIHLDQLLQQYPHSGLESYIDHFLRLLRTRSDSRIYCDNL